MPRTIPLARTYPREHASGEPGTWFTEYRLACPTNRARNAILAKFGSTSETQKLFSGPAPTMIVRQHVDVDPSGRRRGRKPDFFFASTPNEAVTEVGDSSYTGFAWGKKGPIPTGEVESLHPAHREYQTCLLQKGEAQVQLSAAEALLKEDRYIRRTPLEERYEGEYVAALKKARLWSAAKKGTAPQAKIDAVQRDVRARYDAEKTHLQQEADIWRVGAEMDCTPKFDFEEFCRRR